MEHFSLSRGAGASDGKLAPLGMLFTMSSKKCSAERFRVCTSPFEDVRRGLARRLIVQSLEVLWCRSGIHDENEKYSPSVVVPSICLNLTSPSTRPIKLNPIAISAH
jgi:hypothetical protein